MARRSLQVQEKTEPVFTLTTSAVAKVRELAATETGDVALRLEVQPGGCAGFRYGLFFDDQVADSDQIETSEGVRIALDPMSAPYLKGVVIDWANSLQQSGFVINNPNAQGRCACGDSFH
jgi:iron-sulfur cluster assembly accessory protein